MDVSCPGGESCEATVQLVDFVAPAYRRSAFLRDLRLRQLLLTRPSLSFQPRVPDRRIGSLRRISSRSDRRDRLCRHSWGSIYDLRRRSCFHSLLAKPKMDNMVGRFTVVAGIVPCRLQLDAKERRRMVRVADQKGSGWKGIRVLLKTLYWLPILGSLLLFFLGVVIYIAMEKAGKDDHSQ